MAFFFADSFDLYTAPADAIAGYWDSGANPGNSVLVTGRFAGGRAWQWSNLSNLVKSSGSNDAIHHIICAFQQTAAISGSTLGMYFQLSDGATNQVCIVFRSDGAVLLTSATPAGTVLATYTGAVTVASQWFAFEFEVVINNTSGSFTVRKNGNTSNDFTLGSLNTRPGANTQANKLTIGMNATVTSQQLDDVLWRSDTVTVAFAGDVRCYTRMPASDASVQFTRQPTSSVGAISATTAVTAGQARYTAAITVPCDATIGTVVASLNVGFTGNMKCAIFSVTGSTPSAVLATATPITNPATGANTFTFGTPASVIKGTQIIVGYDADTTAGTWSTTGVNGGFVSTTTYAAFPAAGPVTTGASPNPSSTVNYTPTTNSSLVSEAQQDGATTYVYDATVGDADFYGIASIAVTPASVVAVTTRGFIQKSDAGSRSGAVQLKSGSTTVASPTTAASTTFAWMWRTDVVDPATSAAWTPTGVNAVTIGPVVIS